MLKACRYLLQRHITGRAFSLVELLITLLLGSVLFAMVLGLYVDGMTNATQNLQFSRLHAYLQSLMSLMVTDLRRAGYGGSDYLVGENADKSVAINSDHNCIVYYYNHDRSVALNNSNKMAFSLRQHTLKFKTAVGRVADTACSVNTGWTSLSDQQFIRINALTFYPSVSSSSVATLRNIDISLSGELANDNRFTHTMNTTVHIRNVEFID